jgi:hypothetical protein
MKKLLYVSVILFSCANFVHSQSLIFKNDDTLINCETIQFKNKSIKYQKADSDIDEEIDIKKVRGVYLNSENSYYKIAGDLYELVVEGTINLYRVESISGPVAGTRGPIFDGWYAERGNDFFNVVQVAKHGPISKYSTSNMDWLQNSISDEADLKDELITLNKKSSKLEQVINIVQRYNAKKFLQNANQKHTGESINDTIVLLRDYKNEFKGPLEFEINGQKYSLNKNTMVKIPIPRNQETVVSFLNDTDNTSSVLKPSEHYIKYYQLGLDKNKIGSILKVNGNSSYYRTRMVLYQKNAKKEKRFP